VSKTQKDYKNGDLTMNTVKDEFSDNVTQTVVQTDGNA
jgi:hypothetical protein